MHPFRSTGILGLSPIFQCSACRFSPLLSRQHFRPRCLPFNPFLANSQGDHGSSKRSSSTSASFPSPSKSLSHLGFEYRVGASFSAKNRRFNPACDIFNLDPADTAFMTGRPASGQDAFFASRVGNSNNVAFGVADGVGGWADSGIDSAHFSHGLCRYMIDSARNSGGAADKFTVRKLLQNGYDGVVRDPDIHGGGSTACVAVARSDGNLDAANLGDSGFVQLRLNAVHYYSNPQTHAFNTPYQLSIIPPKILARTRALGGNPLCDYPRDASVTSHQVRHGDILIFATDGLWDNLTALDVLRVVSRKMKDANAWVVGEQGLQVGETFRNLTLHTGKDNSHDNPSLQTALALTITAEAKSASLNTKVDSPFAREVQKYFRHDPYHGGKVDDICVVVAVVIEGSKTEV